MCEDHDYDEEAILAPLRYVYGDEAPHPYTLNEDGVLVDENGQPVTLVIKRDVD